MNPRDIHPMEPDYNEREPDLIITFDYYSFEKNKPVIEELYRGDHLMFNASITHLGVRKTGEESDLNKFQDIDEKWTHHIHALDIKKLSRDESVHVNAHYHWEGRYDFNQEMQEHDFQVPGHEQSNSHSH